MNRPKVSQLVIDEFAKIIDSQDAKGFEKYGKTIDQANNKDYNWELMALEETADLQKYLVRRILEVSGELITARNKIRALERELEGHMVDDDETDGMLTQANETIKQLEQSNARLNNDLHEAEEENKWLNTQLKSAKNKISELKTLSRITKNLQLQEENLHLAQRNKELRGILDELEKSK